MINLYVVLCAIWYHSYNLKYVKNTHGGLLLLVTLLHGCFSRFLYCAHGTKSRNVPHISLEVIRNPTVSGGIEEGCNFRGTRSRLICLYSLHIRNEIWRRSLILNTFNTIFVILTPCFYFKLSTWFIDSVGF